MSAHGVITCADYQDDENVVLAGKKPSEELLGDFYGRFPWPWAPIKVECVEDRDFERIMLNQNLGDWTHSKIPVFPRIWVAGCGVNQALQTALRFPDASVIGSDVSSTSLAICERNARDLAIGNLELRQESINDTAYKQEFDYILCTGVIHHNADPQYTLAKLASALNPTGILELMVYNRFHRTLTSSFQKAIRLLGNYTDGLDFEADLSMARSLVRNFPVKNQISEMLSDFSEGSESDFADLLIHPLEHSYTVESLYELIASCELDYVMPAVTSYGRFCSPSILWELTFGDAELQSRYESLSDWQRWQITNLLLHEKSPLLWFYLQHKDRPRIIEQEINHEFLDREFEPCRTQKRTYLLGSDNVYRPSARMLPHPCSPPEGAFCAIMDEIRPGVTLHEIFHKLQLPTTPAALHEARVKLTTSEFPYLKAVPRS
ncbi:MAG TPA: class I SAM-dependent methyltransferase [Bryobacteraceae bacterium]|nr:class I SAM-dependent methyltransferase [Bryobacteraceae bacterium]